MKSKWITKNEPKKHIHNLYNRASITFSNPVDHLIDISDQGKTLYNLNDDLSPWTTVHKLPIKTIYSNEDHKHLNLTKYNKSYDNHKI